VRVSLICACLCLPFTSVVAQVTADARAGVADLHIGERISFHAASARASADCDGNIIGLARDTIRVGQNEACAGAAYSPGEIQTLEVARGNRGSRWAHLGLGFFGGAVAGGFIGGLSARKRSASCSDLCSATGLSVIGGVLVGSVGGGLLGIVWPAGAAWHPVPFLPSLTILVN
jgi:hypothetical protein